MFIITPADISGKLMEDAVNAANAQVSATMFSRDLKNIKITMFGKKLIPLEEVYFQKDDFNWIFGTGTWSYRNKVGNEGLRLIYNDFSNGKLSSESLRGQFALLVRVMSFDKLVILLDSSGIQNLYMNDEAVVSTSFMACLFSKKSAATLNRRAALENLCTGHIISPDTLVNEIIRYHPNLKDRYSFKDIVIMVNDPNGDKGIPRYNSRKEAIDSQISTLDELFQAFTDLGSVGVDFGLTGGLDSRLLLAFALRNWNKEHLSVYTNSRIRNGEEKVIDEPIAMTVAKAVGLELKHGWMFHPIDVDEESLKNTILRSFEFFDGHVRMHTQYFEAYNNSQFKIDLIKGSRVNTSGIGGEQYRNMERFGSGEWNLRRFIDFKTIRMIVGEALSPIHLNDLLDYLVPKVKARIQVSDRLSRLDVKKYYNEILNGDRLGCRNNMENKLYWFLSPFTEAKISKHAYGACDFIGKYNFTFQADMLTRINPALASVRTDYGFIPSHGLSVKLKSLELMKLYLPWRLFYGFKVKNLYEPGTYEFFNRLSKYPFVQEYLQIVANVLPEVSIGHLTSRPDVMPIVVNLGCFIKEMTMKGKLKV